MCLTNPSMPSLGISDQRCDDTENTDGTISTILTPQLWVLDWVGQPLRMENKQEKRLAKSVSTMKTHTPSTIPTAQVASSWPPLDSQQTRDPVDVKDPGLSVLVFIPPIHIPRCVLKVEKQKQNGGERAASSKPLKRYVASNGRGRFATVRAGDLRRYIKATKEQRAKAGSRNQVKDYLFLLSALSALPPFRPSVFPSTDRGACSVALLKCRC